MKGLTFYDKQHIQKVLAQQNAVANIFNRFILSITPFLQQYAERSSNNVWLRNQVVEKSVDRELDKLQSLLLSNISAFNVDAWKRSDMKNEDFITEYIKGMAIDSVRKQGMFATNKDALSQLQKGFDARGNNLSPMVWNLADQTKTQLEYYLQTGLSVGRSSTQIGQDLRQILNEPDRRFRRVKDKEGKLVMSQPMKDYHPGQGVYRSSKMNALRLTATSTNMAYRTADYERWSKQEFTLGIEIQRSANNKGPCKICDAMVGRYPKTFKFIGFHPFCICFSTPIVMEPEDLADYLLTGKVPEQLLINKIPSTAQSFVNDNKTVVSGSYWYKDNFNAQGGLISVVPMGTHTTKVQDVAKSVFIESKTIEEAQDYARNILGVKRADYSDLSIDVANCLNRAVETLPEDNRPLFVGSSKNLQKMSEIKLDKTHYGVSVDGIIKFQEDGKYTVESGMLVGMNNKSLKAIEKSKDEVEEEYFKRTGHHWTFNHEGEATPFHEMGHVYDYFNTVSNNSEWKNLADKWAKEANIDYIKKPSEAFAEAWAATFLNKELPPYIEKYMKKFKRKK